MMLSRTAACTVVSAVWGVSNVFRLEGIPGIWRNLWDDSHTLAAHALTYARAQLKAAAEASGAGLPGRGQVA